MTTNPRNLKTVSSFHFLWCETVKQRTNLICKSAYNEASNGSSIRNKAETEDYLFEERAAIMEYDGNINKDEAEILSLEEVTQITARKQRENE